MAGCLNVCHSNVYSGGFWSLQDDEEPSAPLSTNRFSPVELRTPVELLVSDHKCASSPLVAVYTC